MRRGARVSKDGNNLPPPSFETQRDALLLRMRACSAFSAMTTCVWKFKQPCAPSTSVHIPGSPVGRPEMWCMTQTPSQEFQTAAHVPAPRVAGFWKVSHQTEKLFDFSDKFDAQKCKGPERWATTQYLVERGRPTFRHGILQSRTPALPPDASTASCRNIRSPVRIAQTGHSA